MTKAQNFSIFGSYDNSGDPRQQTSAKLARQWFSELDSGIVEELYQVFRPDFMVYNYSNFTDPEFPMPLY